MVAGAVAGQAAKAAAGKTASGASKAAGKTARSAAEKGGKFGIQTPSQERQNTAGNFLNNSENSDQNRNTNQENSVNEMNYTGSHSQTNNPSSNSWLSKFTDKKNKPAALKKLLLKGSPVILVGIVMLIIPFLILGSGVSFLGSLSENAGFSDIPTEVLENYANTVISRMLDNGSLPSTLANNLHENGIEVGYLDSNGTFIAGLRPTSENTIALASQSETVKNTTDNSLVFRFKDKIIDSSSWTHLATTDPELYAAFSDSTNLRGIAYYDDLANSFFSSAAGNSRNVFAGYTSEENSDDFRDIIVQYVSRNSTSNYRVIDSRCYDKDGNKIVVDACRSITGDNSTKITSESSEDEKAAAIDAYLAQIYSNTLVDCDALNKNYWTEYNNEDIKDDSHWNYIDTELKICDNVQASIISYLVNSAVNTNESQEAQTYFLAIQEVLSKTKAGAGSEAPVNELFNYLTKADKDGLSAVQSPTLSSLLTKSFTDYNSKKDDIKKYSLDRIQEITEVFKEDDALQAALTTTSIDLTSNSNRSTSMLKLLRKELKGEEPSSPAAPSEPSTPVDIEKTNFDDVKSYTATLEKTIDYLMALNDYETRFYSKYSEDVANYNEKNETYKRLEGVYNDKKETYKRLEGVYNEKNETYKRLEGVYNDKNETYERLKDDYKRSVDDLIPGEADEAWEYYEEVGIIVQALQELGFVNDTNSELLDKYSNFKNAEEERNNAKSDRDNAKSDRDNAKEARDEAQEAFEKAKEEYEKAYLAACDSYKIAYKSYQDTYTQFVDVYARWWKKTVADNKYENIPSDSSDYYYPDINNGVHEITHQTILDLKEKLLAKETTFLISDGYKNVIGSHAGEMFSKGGSITESGISSFTMGGTPGTKTVIAAYQKEINKTLALKAEADRLKKSPFDISSQNTFLGSIVNSLSTYIYTTPSLSSLASSLSSYFNQSISTIIPAVFADSETSFYTTYGDCPESVSDSQESVSDAISTQAFACNVYSEPTVVFDLNSINAVNIDSLSQPDEDYTTYINQRLVNAGYTSHELAELIWSGKTPSEKLFSYLKQSGKFSFNKITQWFSEKSKIADYFSTYYTRFGAEELAIINGKAFIADGSNTDLAEYQAYIINDRILDGLDYYSTNNTNSIQYANAFIPGTGNSTYLATRMKEYSETLDDLSDAEYLAKITGMSTKDANLVLGYIAYNSYLASIDHSSALAFGREDTFNLETSNQSEPTTQLAVLNSEIKNIDTSTKRKEVIYVA